MTREEQKSAAAAEWKRRVSGLYQGDECAPDLQEATDLLWATMCLFEGDTFFTAKGLDFQYQIRGNEMFVSRKEKSITKASVQLAFQKVIELRGIVTGPKRLKIFGASYVYPVFQELGLIIDGQPELGQTR